MKKITLFYLIGCPSCDNARRALEELVNENPAYAEVAVEWIEESEQPQLADSYDYYYVPTIYDGQTKLYEARPSESYADCKKHVQAALDKVLG